MESKTDPVRWQKIEEIFHAVSQRSPEEREKFLEERCGDDADLKEEVLTLLAAQKDVGDFMSAPPLEKKVDVDTATSLIAKEELSFIGKSVGPYRLKRLIASGGMGTDRHNRSGPGGNPSGRTRSLAAAVRRVGTPVVNVGL